MIRLPSYLAHPVYVNMSDYSPQLRIRSQASYHQALYRESQDVLKEAGKS